MVAVTILAIALLLSIQPLMASLNRIEGSQNLSAAEKLAQSEMKRRPRRVVGRPHGVVEVPPLVVEDAR